jgi:hypothetical protein
MNDVVAPSNSQGSLTAGEMEAIRKYLSGELTPQLKEAVRGYLSSFLTLAVTAGSLLGILAGLGGYVLTGVAQINANQSATDRITAVAQDVGRAQGAAAAAVKAAEDSSAGVANTYRRLLETQTTFDQVIGGKYDQLATELMKNADFKRAIENFPSEQVSALNAQVTRLTNIVNNLMVVSQPDPPVDPRQQAKGGSTFYTSQCRPGHYAVGVEVEGFPRGAAEFVRYVRGICAPLNLG